MSDSPSTSAAELGSERFLRHLGSAADMVGARRFREAEVEVLRALSITPSDLRALKLLALVRFKLGRLEESRAVCREIAATLPRDAGIRLKLGLIALKLDRIDESVHELETAARLAPEDARSWSYLGFAYARRGERARAAAAFRRAGQDDLAIETETNGAPGDDAGSGSGAAAVPARVEGEGSGSRRPGSGARAALVPAADDAGGSGSGRPAVGAVVSPGAVPSASYEPAFDLSMPLETREPGTDPDRPLTNPRTGSGAAPVSPLVGFAVSRLGPPADQAAWIGAAARLSIADGAFVQGEAAVACSGSARWEEAQRRVRGRVTGERLGGPERPFFRVAGRGELFVAAPSGRMLPLRLEDDVLYVREDRVLAFEGTVSWEYGHVPRSRLRMLQFRGRGLVILGVQGEPGAIKVTPERPAYASTAHLLGWIGRVVARGVDPPGGAAAATGATAADAREAPFQVTCEGEGVVLFDVELEPGARAGSGGRVRRSERS